eukprot:1358679-Rhodomonas_salina.6
MPACHQNHAAIVLAVVSALKPWISALPPDEICVWLRAGYVQCLRKGELFPASFEASVFQLQVLLAPCLHVFRAWSSADGLCLHVQPKQDHHAQLQLEKFLESCGVAYLEDLEDNLSDADMAT